MMTVSTEIKTKNGVRTYIHWDIFSGKKIICDENKNYNIKLETEIVALSCALQSYGLTFMELSKCSPKTKKIKSDCYKVACYIASESLLMDEIKTTKSIPREIIKKNTGVPQKIIVNYRKYIMLIVELLNGDYPCLLEFLNCFSQEGE